MNWATFEATKVSIQVSLEVSVLAYTYMLPEMNIQVVRVMRDRTKEI
jgi:hypothetical protein